MRSPRLRRALGASLLLLLAAPIRADDFWVVPDLFRVAPGEAVVLRGQTSSRFPTSRVAVTPERVVRAMRYAAEGETRLSGFTVEGPSLVLRDRPARVGQYVVAVEIGPRSVRESAAGFRRYLELEGATAAVARVERERLLVGRDSVTRRYAKYATAIVEVGDGGAAAFARVAGHPLEFIPLADPRALKPGDSLTVELRFRGQPLAAAPVHADRAPFDAPRGSGADGHGEASVAAVTDAQGRFRVPISALGLWNVRAVHVVEAAAGSGADWDTHWSSLTFAVAAAQGR
jgi:hypothetical protein